MKDQEKRTEPLYDNIRKFRKAAGLTQKKFASRMGYTSHSAVSRIEKGLVDLPYSQVLLAAEVLGVDPIILMGLDPTNIVAKTIKKMADDVVLIDYKKGMQQLLHVKDDGTV